LAWSRFIQVIFNQILESCSLQRRISSTCEIIPHHIALCQNFLQVEISRLSWRDVIVEHNSFQLFRAYFSNSAAAIAAFVNLAVAETNQGYANTQIPITLALHCILDSSLASQNSFSAMLNNFYSSTGICHNLTIFSSIVKFNSFVVCYLSSYRRTHLTQKFR